ncbi:ABC transporter permease [Bergeyella sp. RCAD1439]|uniref:ABC transporter permease n=1 Tax=Bergeyella anatis TaxID=3113737 RepID=UPI002E172061|nr:ABC transporter permease [Bergeyella sp. RCAD1439]
MANTALYIAKRYLIAKKGNTAVTFITWLAAFAMMTAVAAMFIIVSVFTGLEDLNRDMIANLHADLSISGKTEKKLKSPEKVARILASQPETEHFSKIIEEKVYLSYGGNGEIAYLRAVDSAYTQVNPIDKSVFFGHYPSFDYSNEIILENGLDNRLSIPVGENPDAAVVYMPKPGTGLIHSEADIFTKREVFASGVFSGNDQLNNYIIAPLELGQELLNLPKNSAYKIVVKLKNPDQADTVKKTLAEQLGNDYIIKTKKEENAAFWKMINTEKLMIYLIFALVIFITTFNLAGAIIILQLDKKEQAKALISLGLPTKQLRNIYFYTGVLIVGFGIITGLFIGTLMCYFQIMTGFFKAGIDLPFPVRIIWKNYAMVCGVASLFGITVSWIFSKINKNHLLKK